MEGVSVRCGCYQKVAMLGRLKCSGGESSPCRRSLHLYVYFDMASVLSLILIPGHLVCGLPGEADSFPRFTPLLRWHVRVIIGAQSTGGLGLL